MSRQIDTVMENWWMRPDREEHLRLHLEEVIPTEWVRLVRLCVHLAGSVDVAEDLAEPLIKAWCHAGSLRNPDALRPWLSGIARNVCLRWLREQGRDAATRDRLTQFDHERTGSEAKAGPGEELILERAELSSLLDRARELLPAPTRDLLVQHYIDERPQRKIAARLGVSEGAVAVSVHRGKLALKRVLARPELSTDAAAYGLVDPGDVGWQETHIRCPFCGRRRLAVRVDREAGVISSQCTGPCFPDGIIIGCKWMTSGTSALTSVKTFRQHGSNGARQTAPCARKQPPAISPEPRSSFSTPLSPI